MLVNFFLRSTNSLHLVSSAIVLVVLSLDARLESHKWNPTDPSLSHIQHSPHHIYPSSFIKILF
jgi:hypothetical protein